MISKRYKNLPQNTSQLPANDFAKVLKDVVIYTKIL